MPGLRIERKCLRAHHGIQILLHREARRIILLDDRQCSVALRTEGFHCARVKCRAIGAAADRERLQNLAVPGVQNHHILGIAARGEQDAVLDIERESGALTALAGKVVVRGHGQRLRIHHRDVVLVFDIDIEVALAVGLALFRRAAQIDRARNRTVRSVNHRRIRRAVAQNPDAVVERIVEDAIGSALHIDLPDQRFRLRIPHRDRLAAAKAVTGLWRYRRAMRADIRDFARRFQRVEVEHRHAAHGAGARDVKAASVAVGVDVVEPSVTANFGCFQYLIRPLLGHSQNRRDRQRSYDADWSHLKAPRNMVDPISERSLKALFAATIVPMRKTVRFVIVALIALAPCAAQSSLPTVFVAGDSTANNTNRQGWADPFADYFDPARIDVLNRARAGRSARTFFTEGLWDKIAADVKAGDYVLIQFGHNDGGAPDKSPFRGDLPGIGPESATVAMPD